MARSGATWSVDIEGVNNLKRALRVLQEPDAPFLREALEKSGRLLQMAAAKRAPGNIANKVDFVGVRGKGGALRAQLKVDHPGGRSMEFGRTWYWRGFDGNNRPGAMRSKGSVRRTGRRFEVSTGRGQKARPYLGIIDGGAAIAEVKDEVRDLLATAFEHEWERLAGVN